MSRIQWHSSVFGVAVCAAVGWIVGGGVNVGWNGRFEIRMVRHG